MPPRVSNIRKLESGAEPGLKPKHFCNGFSTSRLNASPKGGLLFMSSYNLLVIKTIYIYLMLILEWFWDGIVV